VPAGLRDLLEALIVFGVVLPFDFGGVKAKAEICRFTSGARPSIEGDDASGIDRAADSFVPRTRDVFSGLDQEPKEGCALFAAVLLKFIPPLFGVALLASKVHDLTDLLEGKVQGQLAHLVDDLCDLLCVFQLRFQSVMNRQAHDSLLKGSC
jgi:hypothetical protein